MVKNFKLVENSGKSALVTQFLDNRFVEDYEMIEKQRIQAIPVDDKEEEDSEDEEEDSEEEKASK